ncbi:MAG: hypothetical protein GX558_12555 [Clostridiales bacterium]|nr:hypothetical protein [Clostridiales bacterium]
MNTNNFAEWLVEAMLSWSRWLADLLWGSINAGGEGGAFNWFVNHWLGLVVFLIIAGSVVDWLVWMVRWRPYWLWLKRDQVVYVDAPRGRQPSDGRERRPAPPRFRGTAVRPRPSDDEERFDGVGVKRRRAQIQAAGEDYFDPFATPATDDPFADNEDPFHIDADFGTEADSAAWAPPAPDPEEDLWADAPAPPAPKKGAKAAKPEQKKAAKATRPAPKKAKRRDNDFDWFDGGGGA